MGRRKPGEAWLPTDTALATALTLHEAAVCPGCGLPQHVGHDSSLGWELDDPSRCHACTHLREHARKYAEQSPEDLRFSVRPVTAEEYLASRQADHASE